MPASAEPIRAVVLTGFMTSGKSTVGRLLAGRLGWRFVDLDREIESVAGRPISRIFEESGEAEFRRLEVEATQALRPFDRLVLAPGGGWITGAAADAAFEPGVLLVWLRIGVDEVLRRAARRPGSRPLLEGPDPRSAALALLNAREPLYRRAHLVVDSDRSHPRRVVARIEAAIRAADRRAGRDDPDIGVPS
jgi:shikimate kinase